MIQSQVTANRLNKHVELEMSLCETFATIGIPLHSELWDGKPLFLGKGPKSAKSPIVTLQSCGGFQIKCDTLIRYLFPFQQEPDNRTQRRGHLVGGIFSPWQLVSNPHLCCTSTTGFTLTCSFASRGHHELPTHQGTARRHFTQGACLNLFSQGWMTVQGGWPNSD